MLTEYAMLSSGNYWSTHSCYTRQSVQCGPVAEWLESRTCDQQVAGSNPGRRSAQCNPGQVVYTRASVTKQYNLVPANGR